VVTSPPGRAAYGRPSSIRPAAPRPYRLRRPAAPGGRTRQQGTARPPRQVSGWKGGGGGGGGGGGEGGGGGIVLDRAPIHPAAATQDRDRGRRQDSGLGEQLLLGPAGRCGEQLHLDRRQLTPCFRHRRRRGVASVCPCCRRRRMWRRRHSASETTIRFPRRTRSAEEVVLGAAAT